MQPADPAQAAGLHSGMQLELTGHFMQQQQQQQGAVTAAAAAGTSGTVRQFAAASLRAWGARTAVPRQAAVSDGSVVSSAAGVAKTTTVKSSNQLVAKEVSTLFIPSEWISGSER